MMYLPKKDREARKAVDKRPNSDDRLMWAMFDEGIAVEDIARKLELHISKVRYALGQVRKQYELRQKFSEKVSDLFRND